MEKKYLVGASIAIITIIGIAFVVLNNEQTTTGLVTLTNNEIDCENLDRTNYELPEIVFSSLPKAPNCFQTIIQEFQKGKFFDEMFFSEEYFLQPEFYPKFKENGLNYWQTPDASRWNVIGYGFYPGFKNITMKEKNKKTIRFFLRTAFGVRSFQGMKIVPEFADKKDEKFVKVSVKEPEFVLEPSYPKFEKNWAKAVEIVIEKKSEFNKGININLKILSPSEQKQEIWAEEFGTKYYNGTSFVGEKFGASITINP